MTNRGPSFFRGGGALGAYEVGVLKGLCKTLIEKDMKKGTNNRPLFDIIAGTSIGAMNAAVLVSNVVIKNKSWEDAITELEKFWTDGIALKEGLVPGDDIPPTDKFSMFSWWRPWTKEFPWWGPEGRKINIKNLASKEAARRYYSAKVLVTGAGKVFSLKVIRDDDKFFDETPNAKWFLLNDEPLKKQIEEFGKFPIGTRFDKGQPRLLVTAVDIAEGIVVTFDSYKKTDGKRKTVYYSRRKYGRKDGDNSKPIVIEYEDGITLDQVMASGALPELYDPKEIGGRKFWDGGVLSNTPLKELLSAHRDYWLNVENKEVPDLEIYIVNVHPSRIDDNDIPRQYDEVKNRNLDILYGDRTFHDQYSGSLVTDYIDLIASLQSLASTHIKDDNERNAFQKKFERLKDGKAKSTSDTLGEDVKYEDLIRGRFETKVMRIEHIHDAATSTSLKGADITIHTIKNLIEEGKKDTKDLVIF